MNPMLRWVGGTALVGVAFTFALKPEPHGPLFQRSPSRWTQRAEAWQTSARDLRVMQLIRTRATAKELARALPPARPGDATFRHVAPLSAPAAARIERFMTSELGVVAPAGTKYPVAVMANVDSSAMGGSYFRTIVLPEASGQSCVVVFGASPQNLDNPGLPPTDRLLGTCGFYAAFGEPGAANKRWLLETQMRAAVHLQRPASLIADTGFLGVEYFSRRAQSEVLACRAGRTEACLAMFAPQRERLEQTSQWWRPSPEMYELERTAVPFTELFNFNDAATGNAWLEAGLLSELATDLGPDRFGQLWRDERPIPEAFAALEGRSLESWIAEYVSRRVEPFQPGSGLLPLQLALAIALTALSSWVGIRFARRELS